MIAQTAIFEFLQRAMAPGTMETQLRDTLRNIVVLRAKKAGEEGLSEDEILDRMADMRTELHNNNCGHRRFMLPEAEKILAREQRSADFN